MAPKKGKRVEPPKETEAPEGSPRTRLQADLKDEEGNSKFNRLRVMEK